VKGSLRTTAPAVLGSVGAGSPEGKKIRWIAAYVKGQVPQPALPVSWFVARRDGASVIGLRLEQNIKQLLSPMLKVEMKREPREIR